MRLHYLFLLLLVCLAACQSDIDQLIDDVFNPKPQCECVPFYLCRNNSVIQDANGLITIDLLKHQHIKNTSMASNGFVIISAASTTVEQMKEGPCDYLEVCCGAEDKLETPITPKPVEDYSCGLRNPDGVGFRITSADDSEEAQFGEFPWMVAILREDVEGNKSYAYQCGGSLVHPKHVLTAAHCVTGKNKYKIRAGEWDTHTTQEIFPHQERDVKTIIIHEHYKSSTLYNDIAILVLKEPFEIMENVNIVCPPPKGYKINSQECFASGWGKNAFGKGGIYEGILKKVEFSMVRNDKCQEMLRKSLLGRFFTLHQSFTCVGGVTGRDTCIGDAGSPLMCPIPGDDSRYYQAGIASWRIGCGKNSSSPIVYTNVAEFRDWIDEQIHQRLDESFYDF